MRTMSVVAACVLLALPGGKAVGHDLLGLYAGGSIGQGRVDASAPYIGHFRENHSTFKVMVGLRPIPALGAEIAYVDFGHPDRSGIVSTDVTMKGVAAFGIVHAPLPIIDIYAKAGLARLQSTVTTTVTCPPSTYCLLIATPSPVSRTNVGFAYGAGAQFKVGSVALRAEYERFSAAGGHPSLLSVGATWTFF
jgi:opacity protein-like surface antigen